MDHAKCDQHKDAVTRQQEDQARKKDEPMTAYSLIAKAITTMDDLMKERMQKKFDISYLMARENLPFTKYPNIHSLEVRHGVDLGHAYQTGEAAKQFVHYIAESQRHLQLNSSLSPFYRA